MRSTLVLLAGAGFAAGCSMTPCRHPHYAVCEELQDRSHTSLIAYVPCLDLNAIGCQPWFQPSSCLATDRRQKRIERQAPPAIPRIEPPPFDPEPNAPPPAPASARPETPLEAPPTE